MDSGAALHEDSEYYLGFINWTSFHRAISSFLKKKTIFFEKMTKTKKSILHVLQGRWGLKSNFFIPKWSEEEALSAVKISSNLKKFAVTAGDFWWIHPYIYK